MDRITVRQVESSIGWFSEWLDSYGETSYDFQTFYASKLGRKAKALYYRRPALGTLAVAPMVFCEAFAPSGRRLFWKPQRFPIADAHYAMGYAFVAEIQEEQKHYQKAVHFLEALEDTRCQGYDNYCWGYPFNWETRTGIIKEGTPLITTTPYAYEAFSQVYAIDRNPKWLRIMHSIAEHVFRDYRNMEKAPGAASCGYTPAPDDPCGVINASAYRAFLLTKAGTELSRPEYLKSARENLNFVLRSQNADGSWYYATDGERDFIDHIHTCFVLKALVKIEEITGWSSCIEAIERGIHYYVKNLFDAEGLPRPFSKPPRLTVYRRELYDYAECINLCLLLDGRFPELDSLLPGVVADVLGRWQEPDGGFKSRQLLFGWDRVPMHRWAQSQLFRSLCFLLSHSTERLRAEALHDSLEVLGSNISR